MKSVCCYSTHSSLCRWVVSNGEDVTLEVERVNGSQLTVTVSFTTWAEQLVTVNQLTFDPAVAGTHFTATSGTLRFSSGEVRTQFRGSSSPAFVTCCMTQAGEEPGKDARRACTHWHKYCSTVNEFECCFFNRFSLSLPLPPCLLQNLMSIPINIIAVDSTRPRAFYVNITVATPQ